MAERLNEVSLLEAFQEIRPVMGAARLAIVLGSAVTMVGVGSLRWNTRDKGWGSGFIGFASKAMIAGGLAVGAIGVTGEVAGRQILTDMRRESLKRIDLREQEKMEAKLQKERWYRRQEGFDDEGGIEPRMRGH